MKYQGVNNHIGGSLSLTSRDSTLNDFTRGIIPLLRYFRRFHWFSASESEPGSTSSASGSEFSKDFMKQVL